MQLLIEPDRKDWNKILQRPYVDNSAVLESVQDILNTVKHHGDEALRSLTKRFDGVELEDLSVRTEEITAAAGGLSTELKTAIRQAKENIETFHAQQLKTSERVETLPGVVCWRKSVAIQKVGIYIPGGTAPLFSTVLMLAIPARLAGCNEIILCTPCSKEGKVHPAVLFAAQLTGVSRIYKLGGAQAIAAMAYGTATLPAVHKIFGPGNQYVTAAKQLVQVEGVAIDLPAGPSEVCVMADETAYPAFVAADLLSQAEHGADSQVLLVCDSEKLADACIEEAERQMQLLPRKEIAARAWANSKAIVMSKREHAIDLVNEYAAEHLIICRADADAVADSIKNAGSVFIGQYSPESVGDYASGTNHTLPTNGSARAYSGVSVDSFVKQITFQKLSKDGLEKIAGTVVEMAKAEGLEAHARAVTVRINN